MITIDEVDKEILAVLGRCGRATAGQISKDLSTIGIFMTDRRVQQRIARLAEKKVIQRYTTILDYDLVTEKTCKLLLLKFLSSSTPTRIEELNEYLATSSYCLAAARLSAGEFDYVCHLVFDTERQFDLQLLVIYKAFGDLIASHIIIKSTIVKQVPYVVSFDPFLESRQRMIPSTKLELEKIRASKINVEKILQRFLNDFIRCLGARYVCLWLISKNTRELTPVLHSAIPEHSDAYPHEYESLSLGKINVQAMLQTTTPVLSNDLAADFKISGANWIISLGLKSYGCYPLISENQTQGLLEMYNDREFSPAEFEMAEKLSSELSGELVNIDF